MDKEDAMRLATRLVAAFPGRDPAAATVALCLEYLERYPAEVGEQAVRRLIERERFLPPLAALAEELRDADEWHRSIHGVGAYDALPADREWTEAELAEARRHGVAVLREYRQGLARRAGAVSEARPGPQDEPRQPSLEDLERKLTPGAVERRRQAAQAAQAAQDVQDAPTEERKEVNDEWAAAGSPKR